jgi:hypothetical protein
MQPQITTLGDLPTYNPARKYLYTWQAEQQAKRQGPLRRAFLFPAYPSASIEGSKCLDTADKIKPREELEARQKPGF